MNQARSAADMAPFFADFYDRLAELHEGINTALRDLPVEALDWVPGPGMNSLAVLAVHTAGAERYWIGDVAGQRPSGRVRSEEFESQGHSAPQLQKLLDHSLADAQIVLANLELADLSGQRLSARHEKESFSVATALLHALEHTAQHMGHMQIGRQLWEQQQLKQRPLLYSESEAAADELYQQARRYLLDYGRPLDQALFRYYFEDGPAEDVIDALAAFANPDGGFGHGLEADVRTPSSSALATEIALRHLIALDAAADHPLVAGALSYLQDTLDPQTLTWRVVPPDANAYPHAPWWHDEDGSLARTFDDFEIIPRAGLVAALHHYRAALPAGWLAPVAAAAVAAAMADDGLGDGGGDALVYAFRLADSGVVPVAQLDDLYRHFLWTAEEKVRQTPEEWGDYGLTPLKLVGARRSGAAVELLQESIQRQLAFEVARQNEAGFWEPVWSWAEFDPSGWLAAREDWRSDLTLDMLKTLRGHGRVA